MGDGDTGGPNEPQEQIKVTDRRRVRPHVEPSPDPDPETAESAGTGPEEPTADAAAPAGSSAELDEARRQAALYFEQMQRMTADFDNARKRM